MAAIQLVIQEEGSTPQTIPFLPLISSSSSNSLISDYKFGNPISVDPGDSWTFSWNSASDLPSLCRGNLVIWIIIIVLNSSYIVSNNNNNHHTTPHYDYRVDGGLMR